MSHNQQQLPSPNLRHWGALTKQIVIVGSIIAGIWLIFRFSQIISPLIIAVIVAYVLNPVVNWVHRRAHIPRTLALVLVYLLLLLLISLMPALVIPSLVKQFADFAGEFQRLIASVAKALSRPIWILGFSVESPDFVRQLLSALQNIMPPLATGALGMVVSVASGLAWLVFIMVVSFYLIKDAEHIERYLRGLVPPDYREEFFTLLAQIEAIWKPFFRGQLIVSATVGIAVAIVVSALGLRNGVILGLIAAVLEVIPNFGPVLAAIPAILLAWFQGSAFLPVSNGWFAIIIAGAYVIIQQVENNYLIPRIIGRTLKLHPAVVLVGIAAGATIGGVLGILLAAPVIATLRVLIKYAYYKLLDVEPFVKEAPIPPAELAVWEGPQIAGRKIEAVLFDLDGTLINTDDELVDQWAGRLKKVERLLPSRDAKRSVRRTIMAAETPANALLTLLDKVELDKPALALKEQLGRLKGQRPAGQFQLVEGVAELLDYLDGRVKLGIITTRSRAEVDAFLEQFGYQNHFEAIVTQNDVHYLKPHPEPILLAAKKLDVPVQRCAMVGDTRVDIQAAKRAGAVAVGVLSGFGEPEDLSEADLILAKAADLRNWL